jgi:hypothetical protein
VAAGFTPRIMEKESRIQLRRGLAKQGLGSNYAHTRRAFVLQKQCGGTKSALQPTEKQGLSRFHWS